MTERRMAHRYDLSLPIRISIPGIDGAGSHDGRTGDISTRGVYFLFSGDLRVGAELKLTLTLPAETTRGSEAFIRATGKVVRVESRGPQYMGVAAAIERYEIARSEGIVSQNRA